MPLLPARLLLLPGSPPRLGLVTRVSGRSMEPTLRDGEEVLVELRAEEPPIGTILLLRSPQPLSSSTPQPLVLHRLIVRHPDGLVTWGDGLPVADPLWKKDQLAGVLLAVRRDGTWREEHLAAGRVAARLAGLRPGRVRRLLLRGLAFLGWRSNFMQGRMETLSQNAFGERSMTPDERFEVQELGNELAIFDRATGSVHVLNTLAADIWRKTARGANVDDLLQEYQADFPDVTLDRLRQDILTTLSSLAEAGLLSEHP